MKFKSLLLVVIFIPTLTMAQAPVIAPPEIAKEPALIRPGEGGGGVYKPKEPSDIKPENASITIGNKPPTGILNDVSKSQQNQIRQDQQEAIDKLKQEIIRNEMIEVRPLLLPPSAPNSGN